MGRYKQQLIDENFGENRSRLVYIGSSSKNIPHLDPIADRIEETGCQVYRFWRPRFDWADQDAAWRDWTPERAVEASTSGAGHAHFERDLAALQAADIGVFVSPFGADAGAELGWLVARGKPVVTLDLAPSPGLIIGNFSTRHVFDIDQLIGAVQAVIAREAERIAFWDSLS
jgi:hypothetical protein